jgi:hypothetical protein
VRKGFTKRRVAICGAVSVALIGGLTLSGASLPTTKFASARAAAASGSVLIGLRRISESQYRNSIASIFGPDIAVAGRFEPETRVDGLLASGDSVLSVTPAGLEGYARLADNIAAQVVNEKNRDRLVGCKPVSSKGADRACAQTVLSRYGRLINRRPLTATELTSRVNLASSTAVQAGDFYVGLSKALSSMLIAPEFLFRVEKAAQTPEGLAADGYTRASRISFLLWNAPPDEELLRAAGAGELTTQKGLEAQVDRMLASPRLEVGMRAFFTDMLQLDTFDTLSKDSEIYPTYNDRVATAAKEETLRMVLNQTITENGDYRDLLTTKKTFVNRVLASVYNVPYTFKSDWEAYEFPADAPRSGILTTVSFLSMFSHPGRSSPTKRGVALREIIMCDPTPPPPANVDFSIINGGDAKLVTVRQRLLAHTTDESCASCHTRSDPIGLSLENFNSIGQYRKSDENGLIDASAKIGALSFAGPVALGVVLRNDPKIPSCVTQNIFAYGAGAKGGDLDPAVMAPTKKSFADSGYRLRTLLRSTLTDQAFYRVFPTTEEAVAPAPVARAPRKIASNDRAKSRAQ